MCTDPTAGTTILSVFDDGSCDFYSYLGCTDPMAWNYEYMASEDDGSCEYDYGCDPGANNWDPAAVIDDGTCDYWYTGCTDPMAWNYDPMATEDDGSCNSVATTPWHGTSTPRLLKITAAASMTTVALIQLPTTMTLLL